jgi:hypothetical protein
MRKIWLGLAFAAIIAEPAPAQDHQKNFVECTKELGFAPLMKPQSFSMHRGRRRAQMVPAPHPKKTPLDGARCRLS